MRHAVRRLYGRTKRTRFTKRRDQLNRVKRKIDTLSRKIHPAAATQHKRIKRFKANAVSRGDAAAVAGGGGTETAADDSDTFLANDFPA
jgi:hypothetical protein